MSDVEWDADDFEPAAPGAAKAVPVVTDKWDGEDEEEDIKDNWDDDEQKKSEEGGAIVMKKKKKTLAQIIAEKEEKKRLEMEERKKNEETERKKMTPEELASEKTRIKQAQEDSDLLLAKEALGVSENHTASDTISGMFPSNSEEFEEFGRVLREKITQFEKSPYYVIFLESLYRDLSLGLEAEDIKKLGSALNTLSNEKSKASKPSKGKKKAGKKATINPGREDNYEDYQATGTYDDMEDFM